MQAAWEGLQRPLPEGVFTEGLPGVGSGQDGSPFLLLHPYHEPSELGLLESTRGGWPVCESAQASSWRALKFGCCSVADLWEGTGQGPGTSPEPDLKSLDPGTN